MTSAARSKSRRSQEASANHPLPWIHYATSAEKTDIEDLQRNAAILDQRRQRISDALARHRDRCGQRRAYEARKALQNAPKKLEAAE